MNTNYVRKYFLTKKTVIKIKKVLNKLININSKNPILLRPFTIRAFREESLEIDIDFVVHNKGLASNWVKNAMQI